MIELNRRLFLFGSAATLAAPALPFIPDVDDFVRQPFAHTFLHRKVFGIDISFAEAAAAAEPCVITIWDTNPFYFGMNTAGSLRWVAVPGNEIIVLPGNTLRFTVDGTKLLPCVELACSDKMDYGDPIVVLEKHNLATNQIERHPVDARIDL